MLFKLAHLFPAGICVLSSSVTDKMSQIKFKFSRLRQLEYCFSRVRLFVGGCIIYFANSSQLLLYSRYFMSVMPSSWLMSLYEYTLRNKLLGTIKHSYHRTRVKYYSPNKLKFIRSLTHLMCLDYKVILTRMHYINLYPFNNK